MRHISSCSPGNLDAIVEMTKEQQQHVLVKVLVNDMRIEKSSVTRNSRRVLKSLNFRTRSAAPEPLYQDFFEKLENPSTEDYRQMVRIFRESSVDPRESEWRRCIHHIVTFPRLQGFHSEPE